MNIVKFILAMLVSYLLGSINFSIVVSKFFLHDDIRRHGSGNAGATNSLRVMGLLPAVLVILGDVLKGVAAVWFARLFVSEQAAWMAAFFCIIGHVFPIFFSFKGGKGVLTGVAVVASLDFKIGMMCLFLFFILVIATKLVSLGSLLGSGLAPFLTLYYYRSAYETICITLIVATIWIKHKGNIERIFNGTEPRLKSKKEKKDVA